VPVTVAEPRATPLKLAEQLPADNVQLVPTVTAAVFEETKVTVPVGVLATVVPSVTVAVQVPVWLIPTVGLQTTLVEVLSFTTVITFDVPKLVEKLPGPLYKPVTVAEPKPAAVKVTKQLPEDRTQLVYGARNVTTLGFTETKTT
jgi:hypothetical protein